MASLQLQIVNHYNLQSGPIFPFFLEEPKRGKKPSILRDKIEM